MNFGELLKALVSKFGDPRLDFSGGGPQLKTDAPNARDVSGIGDLAREYGNPRLDFSDGGMRFRSDANPQMPQLPQLPKGDPRLSFAKGKMEFLTEPERPAMPTPPGRPKLAQMPSGAISPPRGDDVEMQAVQKVLAAIQGGDKGGLPVDRFVGPRQPQQRPSPSPAMQQAPATPAFSGNDQTAMIQPDDLQLGSMSDMGGDTGMPSEEMPSLQSAGFGGQGSLASDAGGLPEEQKRARLAMLLRALLSH